MRSLCDRPSIKAAHGCGTAGRIRRHLRSSGAGSLSLAILVLSLNVGSASATVVQLENRNSIALFHTEASDGPVLGNNHWEVDGVDHLTQQWFLYHTAETGREFFVGEEHVDDPLVHVTSHSINLDGLPGDDFLRVIYRDTETAITGDQFELQFMYFLTGGAPGSETARLGEIIQIINLAGGGGGGGEEEEEETSSALNIGFFQLSNFDLGGTADKDSVIITGNLLNMNATQFESGSDLQIAESILSPPPTHFEAGEVFDIIAQFTDEDIDDLKDVPSALNATDAFWAFQWNFEIAPGASVQISKVLETGPINIVIPLPSTVWCGTVLFGACAVMRRIRRPSR